MIVAARVWEFVMRWIIPTCASIALVSGSIAQAGPLHSPGPDERWQSLGKAPDGSEIYFDENSIGIFQPDNSHVQVKVDIVFPTEHVKSDIRYFERTGLVAFDCSPSEGRAMGFTEGDHFRMYGTEAFFDQSGQFITTDEAEPFTGDVEPNSLMEQLELAVCDEVDAGEGHKYY